MSRRDWKRPEELPAESLCEGRFGCKGCDDNEALNFDQAATENDGTCVYPVFGCTDLTACNFDDLATADDGSCEFTSCSGCLNPEGCNYDATALYVAPCIFPEAGYNCDGTCINPSPFTYLDGDNEGEVICEEFVVLGCTEINACNYQQDANADDWSCEYLSCLVFDCTNPQACNYNPLAAFDDGSCDFYSCAGCTLEGACNYVPEATISLGCDFITCGLCEGWVEEGGDPCDAVCSGDLDANGICDASQIYGCMDPQAVNFSPEANVDNGTCISVPVLGCVIPFACNYDQAATAYAPGACDFSCLYGMPLSGK